MRHSILDSLLFVIFINDLPDSLSGCTMHLYADDTAITVKDYTTVDLENKLNTCLKEVSEWMVDNQLTINSEKTKVMYFGTRQVTQKVGTIDIKHNNIQLESVDQMKYFGIILDHNLTFDKHVQYIKKKCGGRLRMLGKL